MAPRALLNQWVAFNDFSEQGGFTHCSCYLEKELEGLAQTPGLERTLIPALGRGIQVLQK